MKSTSLAIGEGGVYFNSVQMNRKEQKEAASRLKTVLAVGAGIGALYFLTRPSHPTINNLAVAPELPQFAEGYSFSRLLEPYQPGYDGTMLAGLLSGLGELYTPGVLPVSNEPDTPLKLRQMRVIRADEQISTEALRVLTQNTQQRAKRANRDIPNLVKGVLGRYGSAIRQAGLLHNVPAEVIATKICIENPDMLASVVTGGNATGIMQIAPGTADTCLRTEYKKGALTSMEVEFFRKSLGQDRWAALVRGQSAHRIIDLQRPVYNIHIGTLAFGQYMRKYTNLRTGEVELYKAAAEYNRGPRAAYANARVSSPDQLIAFKGANSTSTPPVTQQYIMLYCGPGGPLDYITKNDLIS